MQELRYNLHQGDLEKTYEFQLRTSTFAVAGVIK